MRILSPFLKKKSLLKKLIKISFLARATSRKEKKLFLLLHHPLNSGSKTPTNISFNLYNRTQGNLIWIAPTGRTALVHVSKLTEYQICAKLSSKETLSVLIVPASS